mgnify:CR=1 FL=1
MLRQNILTLEYQLIGLWVKIDNSIILKQEFDELLLDFHFRCLLYNSHEGEEVEDWAFL